MWDPVWARFGSWCGDVCLHLACIERAVLGPRPRMRHPTLRLVPKAVSGGRAGPCSMSDTRRLQTEGEHRATRTSDPSSKAARLSSSTIPRRWRSAVYPFQPLRNLASAAGPRPRATVVRCAGAVPTEQLPVPSVNTPVPVAVRSVPELRATLVGVERVESRPTLASCWRVGPIWRMDAAVRHCFSPRAAGL